MKHRMITPSTRTAALLLLCSVFFAGCSADLDSEESEPVTLTASPTAAPRVRAVPTPSPENDDQPTFTPVSCDGNSERGQLMRIDGDFRCMSGDELNDYQRLLGEKVDATIIPLEQSLSAGASPEATLRELVAVSCDQTLENPFYWEVAKEFYLDTLWDGNPDAFATDWPDDFSVALKQGCFE